MDESPLFPLLLLRNLTKEEKRKLVSEKYQILFKPLIFVFEKVFALTDKPPETPHEAKFVNKYGEFLRATMDQIRAPARPHKPKEVWGRLQQMQTSLANSILSKTQLRLDDISPSLAGMDKDAIPMPGAGKAPAGLAIATIDPNLTILLTKTKPKKERTAPRADSWQEGCTLELPQNVH